MGRGEKGRNIKGLFVSIYRDGFYLETLTIGTIANVLGLLITPPSLGVDMYIVYIRAQGRHWSTASIHTHAALAQCSLLMSFFSSQLTQVYYASRQQASQVLEQRGLGWHNDVNPSTLQVKTDKSTVHIHIS